MNKNSTLYVWAAVMLIYIGYLIWEGKRAQERFNKMKLIAEAHNQWHGEVGGDMASVLADNVKLRNELADIKSELNEEQFNEEAQLFQRHKQQLARDTFMPKIPIRKRAAPKKKAVKK